MEPAAVYGRGALASPLTWAQKKAKRKWWRANRFLSLSCAASFTGRACCFLHRTSGPKSPRLVAHRISESRSPLSARAYSSLTRPQLTRFQKAAIKSALPGSGWVVGWLVRGWLGGWVGVHWGAIRRLPRLCRGAMHADARACVGGGGNGQATGRPAGIPTGSGNRQRPPPRLACGSGT